MLYQLPKKTRSSSKFKIRLSALVSTLVIINGAIRMDIVLYPLKVYDYSQSPYINIRRHNPLQIVSSAPPGYEVVLTPFLPKKPEVLFFSPL